jgi:hypothetical protein
MANNVKFTTGLESKLPSSKEAGKVYFAISGDSNSGYTGSIYFDTDSNTRVKMSTLADAWITARNFTVKDNSGTNSGPSTLVNGTNDVILKLPSTIKASLTGHASEDLALTGGTLSGPLKFSADGTASGITWNSGLYWQRIINVDNSTTDDSVFEFQQSEDSGSSWTTLMAIRDNGKVVANTFVGNASTASTWATSRLFYIQDSDASNTSSGVGVNGSANVTLKLPSTIKATLNGNADTATYASYLICPDTRNDVINPSSLNAKTNGIQFNFKAASVTGLSSSYSGVMTFRPYASGSDWTGGPAHELAFDSNGLHHRTSTGDTTWGSWEHLLTSNNYTSYTVKKDGTGASGTWGISISGTAAKATADASGNTITSTYLKSVKISSGTEYQLEQTTGNGTTTTIGKFAPLDSNNLIDIKYIPQGALERLVVVADDTARLALTTSSVQNGDVVKVTSTNKMYFVKDQTKLTSEDGYEVFAAGVAASVAWSNITGKPSFLGPNTTITLDSAGTSINLVRYSESGATGTTTTIKPSFLPLAGGTMTGVISLKGSQYTDALNSGALNANNSNIYNVNQIQFGDLCDSAAEGIQFYNTSTTVDSLWANTGVLYFTPNRTWGSTATNYTVLHSGNYTDYIYSKSTADGKYLTSIAQSESTGTTYKIQSKYASGSVQATISIPMATSSAAGLISTGEQTFAGKKTFSGVTIFSNTTDAEASTSGSGVVLIGDISGTHLALDGNEIMAKASATTTSTLYLNNNGGVVYTGGNLQVKGGTIYVGSAGSYYINTGTSYLCSLKLQNQLNVNTTGSGSAYGIGLYGSDDPINYGITFRQTSSAGTHGYVTGDWATYITMSNTDNRGWVFRRNSVGGVASINTSGKMWLNGNLTTTAVGKSNYYIAFPDGGSYATTSSTATGYLKVTLPQSWTSTMMRFKVSIYDYSTGRSVEYLVGGYNYNSSDSPSWYNVFAQAIGKYEYGLSNLNVRFGHDGSKCAIYIGESTTTWNYPQVSISDLTVGYTNYSQDKWATGWSIGFTTTLGTITQTISNTNIAYRSYLADRATNDANGNSIVAGYIATLGLNTSNGTSLIVNGKAKNGSEITTVTIPAHDSSHTGLITNTTQTIYGAKTLNNTLTSQIIQPASNGSYTLGTASLHWSNTYTNVLFVSSSTSFTSAGVSGVAGTYVGSGFIELSAPNPYIDFHFSNSTSDYTSRIIESSSGYLQVTSNLMIGGSVTGYKLYVNGTTALKGDIYYYGTNAHLSMIRFMDNTSDAYGNGISIGGGGMTIVGAGESASNMQSLVSAGTETLYLLSDGSINLEANADTIANRIGAQITTSGNIVPIKAEATNTNAQSLGVSGNRWSKLYVGTADSYGSATNPIYWNAGVPTACTYSLNATVNSGAVNSLAYYSAGTTVSAYTSTKGSGTKLWYLSAGVPTESSSTVGSSTAPVYLSSGTITKCSYSLSSTLNSGTANRAAYFSGVNAVSAAGSIYMSSSQIGINTTSLSSPYLITTSSNTQTTIVPSLQVSGYSYYTNTTIYASNIRAIEFRPSGSTYNSYIYYGTGGNEALNFVNNQSVTSFIFWTGNRVEGGSQWYLDSDGNARSDNPALQIKSNCVYINKLVSSGTTPSYKLYVNGTSYFNGTMNTSSNITASGTITGSKVYGAVWNDYAEFRYVEAKDEAGRCVIETGHGALKYSTKRLQPGANIISDTYGFAIGETNRCKTPLAVSGRVLAYPYEDKEKYKPGDAVCSGPDGTVSLMTREEIKEYPDRIIGTVSEIPDYKVWGTGNIKVNGRIWIKVK